MARPTIIPGTTRRARVRVHLGDWSIPFIKIINPGKTAPRTFCPVSRLADLSRGIDSGSLLGSIPNLPNFAAQWISALKVWGCRNSTKTSRPTIPTRGLTQTSRRRFASSRLGSTSISAKVAKFCLTLTPLLVCSMSAALPRCSCSRMVSGLPRPIRLRMSVRTLPSLPGWLLPLASVISLRITRTSASRRPVTLISGIRQQLLRHRM